ncbi:terminase small subunit [Rhodobacteraceae phage LS06-2018-MD05]|nr:terminase small subunit [Rhodobacteraceae phage LS06-2018-MD05]
MAYTKQQKETMFNKVIEYISNGMSLRKALEQDDVFSQNIWDKLIKDEEKNLQYARACLQRADIIFDEMLEIADTPIEGVVIETDDNGRTKEKKGDMLGHRRLQIDSRKWILSKMNPKKYGDKIQTEHSGEIKTTEPKINLLVDGKTFNLKENKDK